LNKSGYDAIKILPFDPINWLGSGRRLDKQTLQGNYLLSELILTQQPAVQAASHILSSIRFLQHSNHLPLCKPALFPACRFGMLHNSKGLF
jgi:hypothetical protein